MDNNSTRFYSMKKILLLGVLVFPFCNVMAALIDFSSATVTASNQYMDPDPAYAPANAIDGDPYTVWNGGSHAEFLTIDMGMRFNVEAVEVENPGGINPDFYGLANYFTILGSLDDINYFVMGAGVTRDAIDPLAYVLLDSPFIARYLRYSVSSEPGVGDHWAHIGELRAFGTTSSVPVPSAIWLFGSGLIGLIGIAKRKKA